MPPSVSVVVCSYTEARWADLASAVRSVGDQTYPAAQIIVVVDYNPSLLARVREELPEAVAIENAGQRGLSGARNSGIAAATGEVIAFLDDDAMAEASWLERLVQPYADARVLGVGGGIDPSWSSPPPAWFPDEFRWVVGCSYRGLPPDGGPVRNLIGANMSFRREVFAQIGGFRSELGHNGARPGGDEETELCIRLRQRWPTAQLVYAPAARVHHHVPASRTTLEYFGRRCYAEGLNKARVSRLVGRRDGLATERAYTFSTLPTGMLLALGDVVRERHLRHAGRVGAIAFGLAATATAYALETVRGR